MNRAIAITSILAPTDAIAAFSRIEGWQLFVAGDRKSPAEWHHPGARYLDVAAQMALDFATVSKLPFNHYGRKMLAYLLAMREGAEVIAESDDDNIPYEHWSFPEFSGTYESLAADQGYVNAYRAFTSQHIWPRGYPLDRVLCKEADADRTTAQPERCEIGIWQGLADKDPDVDAVYRLTNNTPCVFENEAPLVLGSGTYCPCNSQNTAFRREAFPLLYLPSFVSFRYTDILRGLIAQPVLHAAGMRLGFLRATVYQERNAHDYMKDFASEVPCYLHPYDVIDQCVAAVRSEQSISNNLLACYQRLIAAKIVPEAELGLLEAWLGDLQRLGGGATSPVPAALKARALT